MNTNNFNFTVNKETKTVQVVREFNASQDLVWAGWTTAELLDQWWAPRPFAARTRVMNFEVGGRRVYAMVTPEGYERWAVQQFTAINPKSGFSMTSNFSDKDENLEQPGSDWDLTFSEHNGTTTVTITIKNDSLERMERMIEMGFKEGFAMGLQQLEEMLAHPIN
jgi:uncharacterized protein YndB with AHSA1/START domain